MDKFFNPSSIAVIGVSQKPTNLARNIVKNLTTFDFGGIVYTVGKSGGVYSGRKIYKSVLDIPDEVELAVILTPADTVPGILEECGKKGIRHAIIESAGFNEFGEEGKARTRLLMEVAAKYGIRFVGPNCIGLMNLKNGLMLPFLIFQDNFVRGNVSIVSQSGGVAITLLNVMAAEGIGVSKIASIGNKLNVDENDMIEYLIQDPDTDIIVVYLESISDGRRLMELGRSSPKPILIHKANIGRLSSSVAASHTAALGSDDNVVNAALGQVGIARFYDRQTLVNYLKVLPLPKIRGNRLGILSRSGGHAILAADAAETTGFELAEFGEAFLNEVQKHFRANVIKLTNPLDLGDLFDYDVYLKIIEETAKQDGVDGVIFLHVYFSAAEAEPSRVLIEKTRELSFKYNKPIIVCVTTEEEETCRLRRSLQQPVFTSPLEIVKALALVRDFDYGPRKKVEKPHVVVDEKGARSIIEGCKSEGRSPFLQEGLSIFKHYGIPVVETLCVRSEEEAVAAAEKVGWPVVMKVVSPDISHKTDVGGVELNLRDGRSVREVYKEMTRKIKTKLPSARIEGMLIQPMIGGGWEMIIGAKRDPNFGPAVLVGLGGIFVEVFRDVAMRVAPFSRDEALSMLKSLRGWQVLAGARGRMEYDIEVILDVVMRLQRLVLDIDEIKEVDINPFLVLHKGHGGMALDARIIL